MELGIDPIIWASSWWLHGDRHDYAAHWFEPFRDQWHYRDDLARVVRRPLLCGRAVYFLGPGDVRTLAVDRIADCRYGPKS